MLELKPKQKLAVDAVNDPKIDTLFLFGTVGTGKTDVAAHIVISICHQFPNTRWPVFRANISTARETVIPSYLDMLDRMNFERDVDYIYRENPFFIRFPNGSSIRFREADQTKDRDGKKVKGINATGNHIDEADELTEAMFVQATSRKGRKNEYGQPSLSIITLNPTDAEHIVKLYDQYKAGTLPENICGIEFGIEDSWQTQQDIDALMTNPDWWVERYIRNNWKYKDENLTIYKSYLFAKARTETLESGRQTVGYDVAEDGKDRSVAALWDNFTLCDIIITKDTKDKVPTEKQSDWLIKYSNDNSIGYENVAVDGVGIGVGVLAASRQNNVEFGVYKSGFAPDPQLTFESHAPTKSEIEHQKDIVSYDSLRSQVSYMFALGMEQGKIKILDTCPYYKELIAEAQTHHHSTTNKVFKLESKKDIKSRSGRSPDVFDAVVMGLWLQMKQKPKFDFSFN